MYIKRKLFSTTDINLEKKFTTLEEEVERNKERDKLIKKLPKEEKEHVARMWRDVDEAGRLTTKTIDRDNGIIGGIAGVGAGKLISKYGLKGKHSKKLMLSGYIVGNTIGNLAGRKRSEEYGEDIWDKGDEEILEYLKEKDPIERKKLREKYTPIGPLGIGRPDWNRYDWKKKRKQK